MEKQVQLSRRLQSAVNMVTPGNTVADVGCDHAYISIYMIQHNIARTVIAMDVNKGPLERARSNIKKYGCQEQIETRLSDGIKEVRPGEVQTLLIAGMGGSLMQRILSGNPGVLNQISELVLQPQSEIPEFRKYLEKIGFTIVQEDMLCEDGKYYVILKAKKAQFHEPLQREVYYRFGKQLLMQRNPALKAYLQKELQIAEQIQEALSKNQTERSKQKQREIEEKMAYCREALAYYDSERDYGTTGEKSTGFICGKLG